MRLLLLENQAAFAATVSATFLAEHEIVVVGSVLNALDLLRQQAFDAALVDFDLDDTKGDVFVRRVREMGRALPIVAISARADGNQALLSAGADATCAKANFRYVADALGQAMARAKTVADRHDGEPGAKGEPVQAQVALRVVSAGTTGQDRALSMAWRGGTLLVLADGSGGMAGGAEAAQAVLVHISALGDDLSPDFVVALSELDRLLARRFDCGETTAVICCIDSGVVTGASVGDSCAWLLSEAGVLDLTAGQVRKPLLGSGSARPILFGPVPLQGRLLVASDGLTKYVPQMRIGELALVDPLDRAVELLTEAPRLRAGTLQDDVAVVLAG